MASHTSVHGVGHAHGVVPVPERGHDHGLAHDDGTITSTAT